MKPKNKCGNAAVELMSLAVSKPIPQIEKTRRAQCATGSIEDNIWSIIHLPFDTLLFGWLSQINNHLRTIIVDLQI